MQTTARRNEWALDKTAITTEVTKKTAEQVEAPSRDGAFVHGLTLEGCRWNDVVGVLEESAPKEMFCEMPVMTIKAVVAEKAEARDAYLPRVQDGAKVQGGGVHRAAQVQARTDQVDALRRVPLPGRRVI